MAIVCVECWLRARCFQPLTLSLHRSLSLDFYLLSFIIQEHFNNIFTATFLLPMNPFSYPYLVHFSLLIKFACSFYSLFFLRRYQLCNIFRALFVCTKMNDDSINISIQRVSEKKSEHERECGKSVRVSEKKNKWQRVGSD